MGMIPSYSEIEIDVGIMASENADGQRAKGYVKIGGKTIPGVQGFQLSAAINDLTVLKITALSIGKIKAQAQLEITQDDYDALTYLLNHAVITKELT